jgi:DNA primase
MAGKIPREFIHDLLARVDIVDLIDARIPLKRSGQNFTCRCPFHTEKSPSFNVSRDKQFYHCFGCGAHGNAISFLIEYDRLTFVEAVRGLAESMGMPIPTDPSRNSAKTQDEPVADLYDVQDRAARFYQHQLKAHPAAGRAIEYLKRRGVTGELAQRFRLGYAPPGWRNLPTELPMPLMEKAGLVIAKDGRSYDRFRDRIMFPIRDRRGRVVGFGGRVMGDETPKYLNSPETPVFKKHKEVYGLYELLKAQAKPRRIIVVEGYMDVIALAQHGIPNAVATLGTATSSEHVDLLFRYTNELVLCFDGDAAGQNAAWKALEASLPSLREGRSLKFLGLPEGHDPDSLVRAEGAESFLGRVENAQPFSKYFVSQLTARLGFATIATPEQRAALASGAEPMMERLQAGSLRDEVKQELRDLMGRDVVLERIAKSVPMGGVPHEIDRTTPSLLQKFLALLLQNPELSVTIPVKTRRLLEGHEKAGGVIQKILRLLDENPGMSVGGLLESFRETPEEVWIHKLINLRVSTEYVQPVFADTLRRLDARMRDARLDALIHKSKTVRLSEQEREEMRSLMAY